MTGEINPIVPAPGAPDELQVSVAKRATAPPVVRRRSPAAAFTVADGLMLLIGGVAMWLRFGELARLPLSAAEALAALANWQFWSAAPLETPVSSPAYFAFTHLVMGLGGDGDAAARLVPAVFGLLTVLVVWLWRGRVRPLVWLAAELFLAVSPLLVAVSRTAGGDAIALFALLLLVVALSQWHMASGTWQVARGRATGVAVVNGSVDQLVSRPVDQSLAVRDDSLHAPTSELATRHSSLVTRNWAIAAGAALGLGLASSPLFYTGLVALVAAWLVSRTGRREESPIVADENPGGPAHYAAAAIAAGVTLAIVATSLLLYPAGLGAALRLFPAWLAQFALPESVAAALSPLLALLRYEPAVFFLGLPAAVWTLMGGGRAGRTLAIWGGFILAVVLLQSSAMVNTAALLLPAYLLVGLLAAALGEQRDPAPVAGRRTGWFTAVAILGLGALMLAAAGRFARLNLLVGENSTLIALAVLAFVLAGAAVVLAMAWESPAARRGAFVGVALLLIFWQWGSAWQLSRLGANDPRERWVVSGTDNDLPVMAGVLGDLSRQLANSERDLSIFSQVESPVLDWYLRGYTGYQSGPAIPVNATADVIIAPADTEPALPNDYFGADFGLEQREIPNVTPSTVADALKWWLFRESTAATENQRVVLWVRTDLARNE